MRRLILVIVALATAGGLATVPATAGTPEAPEIADPVGDANGVSRYVGSADTRPASIDNADLRAIWVETAYDTIRITDPETGAIARVTYVATGIRYRIRTEAPIRPLPPQATEVRVLASLNYPGASFCRIKVTGKVGSSSLGAELLIPALCRDEGEPTILLTEGVGMSLDGDVLTMELPFALSEVGEHLFPGRSTTLDPVESTVVYDSAAVTQVDVTGTGAPFVIGSDVPADVVCADEPDHPDCRA